MAKFSIGVCMALLLVFWPWRTDHVEALTVGKIYDKSNIQEIKGYLIPPAITWAERDGWIFAIGKLDFDFKHDAVYMELSQKNQGKYEIDDKGFIVLKGGKDKGMVLGMPFPTISPKDPKAAEKIMENHHFIFYRKASAFRNTVVRWVGPTGLERENGDSANVINYQGRVTPMPNSQHFLTQDIHIVTKPFDLKGAIQMVWSFDEPKEDIAFAYIPMLRRLRRVSAAVRSDPYLGSDFCTDDTEGYFGKNVDMNWTYSGETTLLMPFTSTEKIIVKEYPNGGYEFPRSTHLKMGYEESGFSGVPWAPLGLTWVLRPVWIVEAMAKDPYYNYGRQILYLDKDTYLPYFKVVYTRAGEYWKTLLSAFKYTQKANGETVFDHQDFLIAVDDKRGHACTNLGDAVTPFYKCQVPLNELGPDYFTEANVRQLSK